MRLPAQRTRDPEADQNFRALEKAIAAAGTGGGGGSLPAASAAGQAPVSTGAGTTYTAQDIATQAELTAAVAGKQDAATAATDAELAAHEADTTAIHGIADTANLLDRTIFDAKGDVIAATAADTASRVAVGSDGQVFTARSSAATGVAWETPAYLGAPLYTNTLAATAATVTINLPTGYDEFVLVVVGRGTNATTSVDLLMRFNADATAIYDSVWRNTRHSATTTTGEVLNGTSMNLGGMPANTAPAGAFGGNDIRLFAVRSTTAHKTVTSAYTHRTALTTGTWFDAGATGFWRSTAVATSVTLLPSAGSFQIGSEFRLYPLTAAVPKIVRGNVNADGTVAAGTGFTITKGTTGIYTVNFSPAFGAAPNVAAMCEGSGVARFVLQNGFPTASSVQLRVRDTSAALVDGAFSFMTVGG